MTAFFTVTRLTSSRCDPAVWAASSRVVVYAQGAADVTLTLATTQVATYEVYGNLVSASAGTIPLGPAPVYLIPDADTGVSDFSALIQAATVQ